MADTTLYQRLKRLFSTNVIVRNVGGKKLKVIDTQAIQKLGLAGPTDRYNRLYSKAGLTGWGYDAAVAFQAQRKMLFRDYEIMDNDPILNSALDIYADECLGAQTIIPLLDGRKTTIKSLYDNNERNFWIYSLSNTGKFIPNRCQYVKYNGKKKMYRLTFDDGSIIDASENHLWVDNKNKLVYTSNLNIGQGIKVFETKISNGKQLDGYEMIRENGSWEYTHRLVANRYEFLKEQKQTKSKKRVIHHAAFNKRNNSPDCLEWLEPKEHWKKHSDFNKELWSDETKIHKYKEKIKLAHKLYWTDEKKKEVSVRQSKFMRTFLQSLSCDERKKKFGVNGRDNGMYGNGYRLCGEKNGRYRNDVIRINEINIEEYADKIKEGYNRKQLIEHFNILMADVVILNKTICEKYNIDSIKQLRWANDITVDVLRKELFALEKFTKNPLRNINKISDKYNVSTGYLIRMLNRQGYKNFTELYSSYNHKIVHIEYVGEKDAYDLVNVGNSHIYAVELNDGSKAFCHNSTVKNEMGELIRITSENEKVKEVLDNLFYDILNIEFNLSPWIRQLCKYGDFFLELQLAKEYGIVNVRPISVYEIRREEGGDPSNPDFVKFVIEGGIREPAGKRELENFEAAHFRLISDTNYLPYGKSMIEGARRTWKQLALMEDAMLIHRIMRAPEKRVFRVDVGNIPPHEVDQFMQSIINKIKKTPFIDPKTGDYNLKYNIQNLTEDFYLPVRGGDSGTSIDNLPGLEYNSTEDIEYIRDKMMAALKIPRAFLNYEDQIGCIVPETKILLLNGEEKTVKELIVDYDNGIKNYVYSIDERTQKIVPGEIEWAGYTKRNAQLVRITLDNEEYIDCTPDHKFLTRNGKWIEAKELKVDQSLMPLYLDETRRGYTTVYQPEKNLYEEVHRLVPEYYGVIEKGSGKVVHHRDYNKKNNNPENLDCSMNFWEHRKFHQEMRIGTGNGKYKICLNTDCDTKFYVLPKGTKKYCSLECYHEHITGKERGRKPVNYKQCLSCGRVFCVRYNDDKKFCDQTCYFDYYREDNVENSKFTKMDFNEVIDMAKNCSSFRELLDYLPINDVKPLYRFFEYNNIDKLDFVCKYMPLALENNVFMSRVDQPRGSYQNHRVADIEFLDEKKDTCDLTIKKYHNFAVSSGVIIHNSKATLAAEDVRFARTIERLQRIVISELWKMAIIHLYIQGFTDEDLVSFDLQLTNPSTIYEQEKVELWNSKISLARDIQDTKLLSTEWIYDNLFGMTTQEIKEARKGIVKDLKRTFRHIQIEQEGNDPAESGQAVGDDGQMNNLEAGLGSPQQGLASQNGNLQFGEAVEKGEVTGSENPVGRVLTFDDLEEIDSTDGRRGSKFRTRYKDDAFGDDPIGQKEYKKMMKLDKSLNDKGRKFKGGSPLATTGVSTRKVKEITGGKLGKYTREKKVLNEADKTKDYFLDENNILNE